MRQITYIISLFLACTLFIYGVLGRLDAAVSSKYEIDDPSVEISINNLSSPDQKIADTQWQERKSEIEWQEIFSNGLIILSILLFVLLIFFRKRILGKKSR